MSKLLLDIYKSTIDLHVCLYDSYSDDTYHNVKDIMNSVWVNLSSEEQEEANRYTLKAMAEKWKD